MYDRLFAWTAIIPYSLIAFAARLSVAWQFWKSGRAKVEGWNILDLKDSTYFLFANEYSLKLGFADVKLPFSNLFAHAAAIGEHVLPAMLVIGLFSRFAALGLLAMTIVIQLIYHNAWLNVHLWWATLLLLVLAQGPGLLSIDALLGRRGQS